MQSKIILQVTFFLTICTELKYFILIIKDNNGLIVNFLFIRMGGNWLMNLDDRLYTFFWRQLHLKE